MIRPLQDLGFAVLRFIADLGALAIFTLQVVRATLVPPWRLRLFVDELYKLGVLSLVIICVCGLAVGMVLGLQGYTTLSRFGGGPPRSSASVSAPSAAAMYFSMCAGESVNTEPMRWKPCQSDRKSTRLNSSHRSLSRMPSSA